MLWLILGIVIGAGAFWIARRSRDNDEVATPWYGWVLGVIALILGLLAIEVFVGSLAELETQAAWMGLAAFG
ncbi:MAG: dehalogenase, partial [Actinomycetota bacterium]